MKKKKSAFNVKFNKAKEQLQNLNKLKPEEPSSIKAAEPQSTTHAEHESIKTPEHQSILVDMSEKAIDRTTVNFTPAQTEKLARMAIDYKRQTGKKIAPNEILRRLVDKSGLEDILETQP